MSGCFQYNVWDNGDGIYIFEEVDDKGKSTRKWKIDTKKYFLKFTKPTQNEINLQAMIGEPLPPMNLWPKFLRLL